MVFVWPVAINMQHTDVEQIVNLPRFRQVRNLPHVADFLRQAIRGSYKLKHVARFRSAPVAEDVSVPRGVGSRERRAKPWYGGPTRLPFCSWQRPAQRAKSSSSIPHAPFVNPPGMGNQANSWPVGPNTTRLSRI
jgi:hypothetical protein